MTRTFRLMRPDDVPFVVAAAVDEGWAASPAWVEVHLEHDPGGCFIAEVDGESAACITTTVFGVSAWMGNLIVRETHRRQGLGAALFHHAVAAVEKTGATTIRFDADPDGVGIYRRAGFEADGWSLRFSRPVVGQRLPVRAGEAVTAVVPGDWPGIIALDRNAAGDDRQRLLRLMARDAVTTQVLRRNGRLVGFAMAHRMQSGMLIGPCVAPDAAGARELMAELLHLWPEAELAIACADDGAADADAIFSALGFTQGTPIERMIRGDRTLGQRRPDLRALIGGATG